MISYYPQCKTRPAIQKRILLPLLFLIITSLHMQAQEGAAGEDAFVLLKSRFEKAGLDEAKILATRFSENTQGYIVDEQSFIVYSDSLARASGNQEAIFFLESALAINPASFRINRLLATLYYREGDRYRSDEAMERYQNLWGEVQLARYIGRTGEENLLKSAEEVIDRFIEVTGGRDAWESVKTMQVTVEVQPASDLPFRIERFYKRPFFFRQQAEGSARFNTTDGTDGWSYNGKEWIESAIVYRFASIDEYALNGEMAGVKYIFAGLEYADNGAVYHLVRTFRDGFKQDLYFAAGSGLLTGIKSAYPEGIEYIDSFYSLWDYRRVGDVLIPFVSIRSTGSDRAPHGAVITDIRLNVPMSDTLFLPPGIR